MREKRTRVLVVIWVAGISAHAAIAGTNAAILKRNIFADPPPPPPRAATSILRPEPVLPLDRILAIKGVIFSPSGESKAIIEILAKKTEDLFSEGDMIENARIVKIGPKSVGFERDGAPIELVMNQDAGPTRTVALADVPVAIPGDGPPPARSILRNPEIPGRGPDVPNAVPAAETGPRDIDFDDAVEKLKADPGLIGSLNIAPYIENGSVNGFVVNNIPPNSLPIQLGLQNGDVVKRVNGVLIDSIGRGYQMYNAISSTKPALVTVEVVRRGSPVILTYRNNK